MAQDPVSVEVTFDTLPDTQYSVRVGTPDDTIEYLTRPDERNRGAIERALEVINTAPSFDNFSASAIEQQLGDGIYATVETPTQSVWATNTSYIPILPISRQNPPFTAGDVLPSPNSPAGTWEVIDYPTGGPTFENASGMRVQVESDNVTDEVSPNNDMDAQPMGSQFTNPGMLPVDSEMREMAVEFIENDLDNVVSNIKIQRAVEEFNEMATTEGVDAGVQTMIGDAYKQAGVSLPENRARRFDPDFQRSVGGSVAGDRMDVEWPRGISEQELGVVAGNMADESYDRELYSPLASGQLPTDAQTLIRLGEIMEDFAQTRRDVSADYDGQGWYLRVAGVIYQAVDR